MKLCIQLLTGAELSPQTTLAVLSAEARESKLAELQQSLLNSSESQMP